MALDVNFIDTADAYGPEVSERLIAEALYPYPGDLVIATKGGLVRPGPGQWVPDGRPEHLRQACEGSLARLRLDRIDLYQFHRPDPKVPIAESVGALAELKDEGKIRHIGVSNVTEEQLREAERVTAVVSVQNRYNVVDRSSEPMLDLCDQEMLVFFPWAPTSAAACRADVAYPVSCSAAMRASWTREVMPSFQKMWRRWKATVCGAQEHPVRHLAVAEPLGHQVGDAPLGVGQAVPAEGRPVRVGPVPEPGAGGAQPGPDPGQVIGVAELLVQGICLPEQGRGLALIALLGPGVPGVLQRAGPGPRGRVAPGGPLQGGRVLVDQPAGVVGGGRHVRVARRDQGQPLRLFGQRDRPGLVAVGERAADQQHGAFRVSRPAAEQGQLQVLFEVLDVGMDVEFDVHQASSRVPLPPASQRRRACRIVPAGQSR